MAAISLATTLTMSGPVDRAVPVGPHGLVVQIEQDLISVDLITSRQTPLVRLPAGSQILAVTADGSRISFDNAGQVVSSDAKGAILATTPLGDEVEFVEARSVGEKIVLLVAESVGDPLVLGIPRYRFVLLDQTLSTSGPIGEWGRPPRFWLVDPGSRQLVVFPAEVGSAPESFDVETAETVEPQAGMRQKFGRFDLVEMAMSPDGTDLVISLWDERTQRAELRTGAASDASTRVVRIFETADGLPHRLSWSPGGDGFVFLAGKRESPDLTWASRDESGKWAFRSIGRVESDGIMMWCGPRLIVQTTERELTVMEWRAPERP